MYLCNICRYYDCKSYAMTESIAIVLKYCLGSAQPYEQQIRSCHQEYVS